LLPLGTTVLIALGTVKAKLDTITAGTIVITITTLVGENPRQGHSLR
jgi:hypothetical protein